MEFPVNSTCNIESISKQSHSLIAQLTKYSLDLNLNALKPSLRCT